jgi:predicted ABC-type ATPase
MKVLEIIGGPNGSGKSTFAKVHLREKHDTPYVNSDMIARGLTLNGNEMAQFEAGRIMLQTIDKYLQENRSFGFETTLSGRMWTSQIEQVKKQGYKIIIYFIYVNSIAVSLKRIKNRVKHGGHDIPKAIVKRRFERTFSNFIKLYAPLADEWYIIDNSNNGTEIANMKNGKMEILNEQAFKKYFS